MKHRTVLTALTLIGIGLGVTTAFAGDEQATRRMRIDIKGGALVAGNDAHVTIDGKPERARADVGAATGLGVGYRLSDLFDATIDSDWTSNISSEPIDASYTSVTAGARFYPIGRDHVVRPWLLGEAGWYHGEAEKTVKRGEFPFSRVHTSSTDDDGGGLNIGAGFDVPVGRLVSLGAGLRYNQTLGVFDDPGYLTTMAQVSFHFWK